MEHIALTVAVFLGGVVTGFSGFAFSAVAGAILLQFFHPLHAIPLMMTCSVACQLTSLAVLRRIVCWREVAPLLIGGTLGVPIAISTLMLVEPHAFRVGFGIFLASYACYMLVRPRRAAVQYISGPLAHSAVGFAGGVIGGLTAMPGAAPAIWCELRGFPKERQRGLVQPFVLGMQLLAIGVFVGHSGTLDGGFMWHLLLAMPALAVGTLIGVSLFGKINDKNFRLAVLALLLVSGCLMMR